MENERKLATICTIAEFLPIEGADQIVCCTMNENGWQCIIRKDSGHSVGDMVVYFEVDSIVPEKPDFEFLRDRNFRVRTLRMKGQISQGLIMPLDIFKNYGKLIFDKKRNIIGVELNDNLCNN